MRIKKHYELPPKRVSTICRHTKNKSWRRYRLYFRGRMQCWWIVDFETDYKYVLLKSGPPQGKIIATPLEASSSISSTSASGIPISINSRCVP
jgi:hypothetical protein